MKNTATRTAGHPGEEYDLWMYDTDGNNTAIEGECKFVWVEIAYVLPKGADKTTSNSDITFQLTSV